MFLCLGLKSLRYSRLTFWVEEDFRLLCQEASERLKVLDPVLFEKLVQRRVWLYHSENALNTQAFSKTFSITPSYLRWKSDGIIARLVYIYYLTNPDVRRVHLQMNHIENAQIEIQVRSRTQFWLALHDFPDVLIKKYD